MKVVLRSLVPASLICASAFASAQADLLNMETAIGSFKLINGEGTVTFSFEGTVLLVGAEGDVKLEGDLKKEFDSKEMKRQSYFGKGRLTIKGKWRGIQWFGTNLKGFVKGKCTIRFNGEFDKNLDTGFYWYGDKFEERRPWFTSGMTIIVPEDPRSNPQPTRRGGYGGG